MIKRYGTVQVVLPIGRSYFGGYPSYTGWIEIKEGTVTLFNVVEAEEVRIITAPLCFSFIQWHEVGAKPGNLPRLYEEGQLASVIKALRTVSQKSGDLSKTDLSNVKQAISRFEEEQERDARSDEKNKDR